MRIKVEDVIIGRSGDSVVTTIDEVKTQIAFDKKDNVEQYKGKYIDFSNTGKITVQDGHKLSK